MLDLSKPLFKIIIRSCFTKLSTHQSQHLWTSPIWPASCENESHVICGQRRSSPACAIAQSDQALRCPFESQARFRGLIGRQGSSWLVITEINKVIIHFLCLQTNQCTCEPNSARKNHNDCSGILCLTVTPSYNLSLHIGAAIRLSRSLVYNVSFWKFRFFSTSKGYPIFACIKLTMPCIILSPSSLCEAPPNVANTGTLPEAWTRVWSTRLPQTGNHVVQKWSPALSRTW